MASKDRRNFSRTLPRTANHSIKVQILFCAPFPFMHALISLQKRQPVISNTAFCLFVFRIPFEMPKHRSYILWVHWSELSSGRLDLIGRLGVEVLPDGVVVYGSTHGDKQVPDGVSKWNDAVTFEKDHPQTVTSSAHQQLAQPGLLRLEGREEVKTGNQFKSCQMFVWLFGLFDVLHRTRSLWNVTVEYTSQSLGEWMLWIMDYFCTSINYNIPKFAV